MNLVKIIIKNTFAHTNTVINFKDGINYIIGKNESGKSVVLGMIAYALFGTAALRGPVTDYKKLEVTLIFEVNGIQYIVHRSIKDTLCKIIKTKDEAGKDTLTPEDLAIGKSPVNTHIIGLLGYGLDVFYKMNFSQQLDGDSYATSKKSERLDLINKINGVDEANLLEKYLENKKKAYKSEIKGLDMSSVINNITFISDPKLDHLKQQDLEDLSTKSVNLYNRITSLEKILTANMMIPKVDEDVLHTIKTLSDKSYFSLADNFTRVPVHTYIEEYEAHEKAVRASEALVHRLVETLKNSVFNSKKTYDLITQEEVLELQSIMENNHNFKHKELLLSKGTIQCPSCSNTFPLMYQSMESIKDLEYIESDYTEKEIRMAVTFVEQMRDKCLQYRIDLLSAMDELNRLHKIKPYVSLDRARLDYSQLITSKKLVEDYEKASTRFKEQFPEVTDISLIESELLSCKAMLDDTSAKRHKLELYLREKSVYTSAQESKRQIDIVVKERQEKIKAYDSFIEESKAIKLAIQNRSIPSLNKKSSEIVNKMTGGEHYSLTLSESFELLLDGKLLSAYSGSTQVTANVAFRISLIELFYKKTFPVFIGDEIDSFADKDRAEHIHKALNRLAKEGYQILLISHHSINFEGNVIDLNSIKASIKKGEK